jgi:hypothetical protein
MSSPRKRRQALCPLGWYQGLRSKALRQAFLKKTLFAPYQSG